MVDLSREEVSSTRPDMPIGRIISVTGAHAVVELMADLGPIRAPQIGALLKFPSETTVIGIVTALHVSDAGAGREEEKRRVEIEFVGEIAANPRTSAPSFRRGVTLYPTLGDPAIPVSTDDISRVYRKDSETAIRIGTISKASTVPAMVEINELLGKHVAILGSTGTGKSCAVALLLRRVIEKAPLAHIVLLDAHNEYAAAFEDLAEIITPETFRLPFWLLEFEELCEILIGQDGDSPVEMEILRELIPLARARFGSNQRRDRLLIRNQGETRPSAVTVNTPLPYRISDLLSLLDEGIARGGDPRGSEILYKRLKSRIEFISRDPRFAFMFGSETIQDNLASILSQLFRIPVAGKPIALVELGSLPSEAHQVVVSVLARLCFDFGLWGGGHTPLALVCEEAHRFAPADHRAGFAPAQRALSRIAREGRKYGLSLVVVSQRPSELDPALLSRCSTIFTLRLTNERDQDIVRAGASDATRGLLAFLPSLGTGEAAVFGEGASLPTHIRFDRLEDHHCPRSVSASFSVHWTAERTRPEDLDKLITRWRSQGRAELSAQYLTPHLARVLADMESVALSSAERARKFDERRTGNRDQTGAEPSASEQGQPTRPEAADPAVYPQQSSRRDASPDPLSRPEPGGAIDWRRLKTRIIASAVGEDAKRDPDSNT